MYKKMGFLITSEIIIHFAVTVFGIWWSVKTIRNRKLLKKFKIRNKKTVRRAIDIMLLVYIVLGICLVIVPAILDMPYILSGGYESGIFEVCDFSHDDENLYLWLQKDGKTYEFTAPYDTDIYNGEKYLIHYLPHTEYADIIKNQQDIYTYDEKHKAVSMWTE